MLEESTPEKKAPLRREATAWGFPLLNSDNPTEEIKRLQSAADRKEITIESAEPNLAVTKFINSDVTYRVLQKITHKSKDKPLELDGYYLVRVFKGSPHPILFVDKGHVVKRDK